MSTIEKRTHEMGNTAPEEKPDQLADVKAHFAKGGRVQWKFRYDKSLYPKGWNTCLGQPPWEDNTLEFRIHPDDIHQPTDKCPTCGGTGVVEWANSTGPTGVESPCADCSVQPTSFEKVAETVIQSIEDKIMGEARGADKCPTCGSDDKAVKLMVKPGEPSFQNCQCFNSWHTSDAATPAPEPRRPKYRVGDKVRFRDTAHTVWEIESVLGASLLDPKVTLYCIKGSDNTEWREDMFEPATWQMPTPPAGHEWHRNDFTEEMLPPGTRPLCKGEALQFDKGDQWKTVGYESWNSGDAVGLTPEDLYTTHCRTTRPAPTPAQSVEQAMEYQAKSTPHLPTVLSTEATIITGARLLLEKLGADDQLVINITKATGLPAGVVHEALTNVFPEKDLLPRPAMGQASGGEMPTTEQLLTTLLNHSLDVAAYANIDHLRAGISAVREACMRAKLNADQGCEGVPSYKELVEANQLWSQRAEAAELQEIVLRGLLEKTDAAIADLRRENESLKATERTLREDNEAQRKHRRELQSDLTTARESLRKSEEKRDSAWSNRNHFCRHINIIAKEVLGWKHDSSSPEAVSREVRKLVDSLHKERDEANQQRLNWVEAYGRLNQEVESLRAQSGWIPLTERKPTRADADDLERVLWRLKGKVCEPAPFDIRRSSSEWFWHPMSPLPTPTPSPGLLAPTQIIIPPSPEEQEMVPLEASDVPPGSRFKNECVYSTTELQPVWIGSQRIAFFVGQEVNVSYIHLKGNKNWRIKRPGEDWQPCSKPALQQKEEKS